MVRVSPANASEALKDILELQSHAQLGVNVTNNGSREDDGDAWKGVEIMYERLRGGGRTRLV